MDYRALERSARIALREGIEHRLLADLGVCQDDRWGVPVPAEMPGTLLADKHERRRVSIRRLFEAVVPNGRELVSEFAPSRSQSINLTRLVEAGEVNTGMFANIIGQIVYNELLDAFRLEDFVFSNTIPSTPSEFNGEKIAGITGIGDDAATIQEGAAYPRVAVSEDYIETPVTVKRGMILEATKESVFFDRTGLLFQRAAEVGKYLGVSKEKRIIDVAIDENTTAGRYKWRGTTIATYDDNTGSHTWDNLQAANALVDWTDVEAADLLLSAITDPNTGEPIVLEAQYLICTTQLKWTAMRIRNATETTVVTPGFATTGNPSETKMAGGPYAGSFEVLTSRFIQTRLATDTSWFWGDLVGAFGYMENWPITVVQQPPNSQVEFERDVIYGWKASERGAAFTREPRKIIKSTA